LELKKAIQGFKIDRLSSGFSPNTINNYIFHLSKFVDYLGNPELEKISSQDIKDYFYYLKSEKRISASSHHAVWKSVRSFFNWASAEFGLERPDNIPSPKYQSKPISPFSNKEIYAIISACDRTGPAKTEKRIPFTMTRPTAKRDKAIILFLLDTGIRVSELSRLKVGDVFLETGEVIINPFLSGKKSRSRIVYIGKTARKAVWSYLADRGDATEEQPLFIARSGRRMTRDSILKIVKSIGRRAGVQRCHPHRFRHTFAIQYLRNGGDVFTLQRLLGHSSLEMVRQYLALADTDAAEAHRKASPVDRWGL